MRHEANKAVYQTNFYPRPLQRGRRQPAETAAGRSWISIHALFAEGDDDGCRLVFNAFLFLSTPSSQRATTGVSVVMVKVQFLSTPSSQRATTARCTTHGIARTFLSTPSSQRATTEFSRMDFYRRFLSTPSSQRATSACLQCFRSGRFLSTPSSQRATLRAEHGVVLQELFLSTPSSQRATPHGSRTRPPSLISIHALFAEGDGPAYPGRR